MHCYKQYQIVLTRVGISNFNNVGNGEGDRNVDTMGNSDGETQMGSTDGDDTRMYKGDGSYMLSLYTYLRL